MPSGIACAAGTAPGRPGSYSCPETCWIDRTWSRRRGRTDRERERAKRGWQREEIERGGESRNRRRLPRAERRRWDKGWLAGPLDCLPVEAPMQCRREVGCLNTYRTRPGWYSISKHPVWGGGGILASLHAAMRAQARPFRPACRTPYWTQPLRITGSADAPRDPAQLRCPGAVALSSLGRANARARAQGPNLGCPLSALLRGPPRFPALAARLPAPLYPLERSGAARIPDDKRSDKNKTRAASKRARLGRALAVRGECTSRGPWGGRKPGQARPTPPSSSRLRNASWA